MSPLHMLAFSLDNPCALSLDVDGPFPVLGRLLTSKCVPIKNIDLSCFTDKIVLITGATGGCGLQCAKAFARAGCHLILTARSREKGEAVARELQSDNLCPPDKIDVLELDMTSYISIEEFKVKIKRYPYIDLAILNAGVYLTDFQVCPETGQEQTMQVNYLSTCAISLLLIPMLLQCPQQSRLLIISSEAHAWADPRETSLEALQTHLNLPGAYKCYERYHITKLLLVLWVHELSTRIRPEKLLVASASPGFCRSGLFRPFNSNSVAQFLEALVCRSPEEGASQYIMAVKSMSQSTHGAFYSDNKFREPAKATKSKRAIQLRNTLWEDMQSILPDFVISHLQEISMAGS